MYLEPAENYTRDLKFSCDIRDMKYRTDDKGPFNYSVWIRPQNDYVLDGFAYACDNRLTVYGIREAVEEYMREKGRCYVEFVVGLENEDGTLLLEHQFFVLYSSMKQHLSVQNFTRNFFLTTFSDRPMNYFAEQDELYFYAVKGETLEFGCELLYRKRGETDITRVKHTQMLETPSENGIDSIYVDYQGLEYSFDLNRGDTILAVIYNVGKRTCTYYNVNEDVDVVFQFRNIFNVSECCGFCASSTSKMETNFNSAICNGVTSKYNIEHSKSFEVETEPLTLEYARWLEQMLISHDIRNDNGKILITDYTFDLNVNQDKPITLKFTWEYAEKRRLDVLPLRFTNEGFFTREFMEQFN